MEIKFITRIREYFSPGMRKKRVAERYANDKTYKFNLRQSIKRANHIETALVGAAAFIAAVSVIVATPVIALAAALFIGEGTPTAALTIGIVVLMLLAYLAIIVGIITMRFLKRYRAKQAEDLREITTPKGRNRKGGRR